MRFESHAVESASENPEVQMRSAAPTMFGCPAWSPDTSYDVVFVGVPSDAGGLGERSPAAAPAFFRTASSLFPYVQGPDGAALGWFDYTSQRVLLEGVRMADAGDLVCSRAQGVAGLASLPALYRTLRENTRELVILGGDHSISYYLGHALTGEGLIWIDAHEDARPKAGPLPDCANVVRYLDELDTLPIIAQYGLRGLVSAVRRTPPPHRRLCRSSEEVAAALQAERVRAAALSIDVDVFDPALLPAVGSPMPEGLKPAELLQLFELLRQRQIDLPVIELTEFAPASDYDIPSALLLVNFLLRALALCLAPIGERSHSAG